MKTQKFKLAMVLLFTLSFGLLVAQSDGQSLRYWVHEDVVKPSMVAEYESVCKELVANLKKHNIQEVNMITANLSDSRYLYVGPIENMAQLDKPIFATLADKMGKDAMGALFNRMDKCYDVEHDYIISLDTDLSYMPGGITQTPEGQNYRQFHYLHVAPGDRDRVKDKMKAIKSLFESKGSKENYRVYKSGFGTRGEFYMVAIAAKDALDYANNGKDNDALIGEEGQKMFQELFGSILKYEKFDGWMRPDMAYSPSK